MGAPPLADIIERVGEELKHLRKECRSLARKLEDAKILQDERDYEEEELRHKVRKTIPYPTTTAHSQTHNQ